LDRHTLVLELDLATHARLAKCLPRLATFGVLGGWLHCWTRPKGSQTEVRGTRHGLCIYYLFVTHPSTHHDGPLAGCGDAYVADEAGFYKSE